MSVLDRFLRYVQIDTRADDASTACPSTPGQLTLQRLIAAELEAIGLTDVLLDENGYLMATIPATAARAIPTIGFIAHVDTSPEMSGAGVKPILHRQYDGRDLVLPDDPSAVLRLADNPALSTTPSSVKSPSEPLQESDAENARKCACELMGYYQY